MDMPNEIFCPALLQDEGNMRYFHQPPLPVYRPSIIILYYTYYWYVFLETASSILQFQFWHINAHGSQTHFLHDTNILYTSRNTTLKSEIRTYTSTLVYLLFIPMWLCYRYVKHYLYLSFRQVKEPMVLQNPS